MKKLSIFCSLLVVLLSSCYKSTSDYYDPYNPNVVNQNNIWVNYTAAVYINNNLYPPSGYSLIGMYSITNASTPMIVRLQSVFVYGGSCSLCYSTDGTSWYYVSLNGNSFSINTSYNHIYFARYVSGNSGYIYISGVNNYSVNQVNAGF